jgi:translation initiation factor IF-2
VSINQRLDAETITMVADEFGYEVEFVSVEVQEALESSDHEEDYDESDLEERAPIVTVMGHVDHGKTSLLDFIRKTNVIGGEAGGITQHIGAYEVLTQSGKKITFLDTPGHEAFTAMRARGAQVTDVAIIVIAADDKIMPQTIEAINHAQAVGVPTVFAINKIDKPGASPDKIKEELSQRNILVEEWGGKYQSHDISAKHGKGIDDLLEKVMLEAELLELKGNPKKNAKGTVVESSLDRGRGYISKLLVQEGTLSKGDYVLAGSHSGKVKAMYNERNQVVDTAGPSTPVLMLGLDGAPQAGDQFNVLDDEREAKDIAVKRRQLQREQGIRTQKHITLDEIGRRIAVGDFKELNIIVKGDVDGSVEALADSLLKQSTDEVQLNVIHKSVGQISESDVMLASASDAIIVGFQVRPSVAARKLAEKEQIDIRVYSVIYKAIEEIRAAIEGMLSPDIEEKIVCNLEIRDVFKITKVGTIAGCMVLDGTITRNTRVRVIRDGIVIYTGNLGSLKRYKDDVREVKAGYECGLNIENFNDIKVGDIIEGFEEVEVARKL